MRFVPAVSAARTQSRETWLAVHPKGLVATTDGGGLAFPSADDLAALGADLTLAHRLGTLDDTDVFALPVTASPSAPFEIFDLRKLAGLVDRTLFAAVGRAFHACDWLTTSRFCGRCGTATQRSDSERSAVCPACDLHIYPRISPAIITLVRKGDLALLASNAKFPGAFYSTLAGFSDIGESLEETLVREVKEEVGVAVTDVRYFGSQPWPFPNSLMIAFTARWASGDIVIDPAEISDAKWFSASELPRIPPRLSIARQLIDAWIADTTQPDRSRDPSP